LYKLSYGQSVTYHDGLPAAKQPYGREQQGHSEGEARHILTARNNHWPTKPLGTTAEYEGGDDERSNKGMRASGDHGTRYNCLPQWPLMVCSGPIFHSRQFFLVHILQERLKKLFLKKNIFAQKSG
jgi:hypothetical protein